MEIKTAISIVWFKFDIKKIINGSGGWREESSETRNQKFSNKNSN